MALKRTCFKQKTTYTKLKIEKECKFSSRKARWRKKYLRRFDVNQIGNSIGVDLDGSNN